MVDLGELCGVLKSAMADGGGHKVFFYAAGKHGAGLRHGFIAIVDSRTCQLNFEQFDNDRALTEIPQLNFIKVQALPMIGQNPATGSNPLLDVQHVLNLFDPGRQSASTGVPQAPAETQHRTAPEAALPRSVAAHATPGTAKLPYTRLREDATALLQTYYGNSAPQKIADVVARFSPVTQPAEFLDACRQLTAVLVGTAKANEVFRALSEKLD
ncbi:MAG: hypothetical protein HOP03_10310 [Lysobacter sp.]|nr:hypothetical protein [Lysobacter sp.]